MRTIHIYGALFLLASLSLYAQQFVPSFLPSYLVRFAPESIFINGDLEGPAWSQAPWSSYFVWIDAGDAAPLKSRFKALYNEQGLYFTFEYETVPKPEAPLDPDFPDACEIFLDPEGHGQRYFEYAAAPNGAEHQIIWNGRLSIRKWQGGDGITSEVKVTKINPNEKGGKLIYQVFFPWKGMSNLLGNRPLPPAKGEHWRANFSRVEHGKFQGDYVWAPMGIYYMHHPGPFGWLVFSGATQPITKVDPSELKPLKDVSYDIPASSAFPLFSRILWTRFPLIADGGGYYAVSKTFVDYLDSTGRLEWARTRKEGLPQFIHSVLLLDGSLYVTGSGIHSGIVTINRKGEIAGIGPDKNPHPESTGTLVAMGATSAITFKDDQYQLINEGLIGPVATAGGPIQCAVPGKPGQIILGTETGFESHDFQGNLLWEQAIAGGIVKAMRLGDSVIGVSGQNGLYRLNTEGKCNYYPHALRTGFDGIYIDGHGGCWAPFTGGLIHIVDNKITTFLAPLGIYGLKIDGAVAAANGHMVFICSVPSGYWYGSNPFSSFLLIYDGKNWKKSGVEEGLPGLINAITLLNGNVFLSTSAGIFQFRG